MNKDNRTITAQLIFLFLLAPLMSCGLFGNTRQKVHTIEIPDPVYDIPAITDKEKFLNDLMLSPYWKVEKESDGYFRARARAISAGFGNSNHASDMLLFEIKENGISDIPAGHKISNKYMEGGDSYSSFTVDIVFQEPPEGKDWSVYQAGKPIVLDVYESYDAKIGPNSYSTLLFDLSGNHDIYLLVREQGDDLDRRVTFETTPKILKEIERVSGLSANYSVQETYMAFFRLTFDNLAENSAIKRRPGLQDRDTFFGYLKTNAETVYDGINIKISHPVFCDGECTRASSRIEKAEYLGMPYHTNDLLFFQIEDNAVYLAQEAYDQKYGTFSGNESFEGKIEIANAAGDIIYEALDYFKGWER